MVKSSEIALLGGIALLAFVFSRSKNNPDRITQKDLQFPTIPISKPVTLIKPVSFPSPISLKQAFDIVKENFGQLYTRDERQVDITKTLEGHAEAYYGSGQDERYMQDYQRWLAENRTIVTKGFLTEISL